MTDSITLYPSGQVRAPQTIPGRKTLYGETKLTIDTEDTIRTYELSEVAEDQGVIEGHEDNPLMKTSITLAGTNADDSTFNYNIPVIED